MPRTKKKNVEKTDDKKPKTPAGQATRETVESLVIALVLAFFFRTFQAEAFVIPTGSMAPTLMGRHKDVDCVNCGKRYQVNASQEASAFGEIAGTLDVTARNAGANRERAQSIAQVLASRSAAQIRREMDCMAGACENCRRTMAYRDDMPDSVAPPWQDAPWQPSYSGDRLIVNKYIYSLTDPKRWDVMVFKFPGDTVQNYIKRLVGLPGEEIKIMHGDIFVRPADSAGEFEIARKPDSKLLAMRQLVHDTDYDPAILWRAGWPLRWGDAAGAWQTEAEAEDDIVSQTYRVDAKGEQAAWLRYEHTPASGLQWGELLTADSVPGALKDEPARRELIADYNAYNTQLTRLAIDHVGIGPFLFPPLEHMGIHWTADLCIDAEIEIKSDAGELLLDLVEAGKHFRCTFDIATGVAKLTIHDFETDAVTEGYAPAGETDLKGAGEYEVRFANFDDELRLWIDGDRVEFDSPTTYDADELFGDRQDMLPQSNQSDASDADRGDLAPVGIGARNASIAATRLQVWRDLYYIATNVRLMTGRSQVTDLPKVNALPMIVRDPQLWDRLSERQSVTFTMGDDHFFMLGDNSAESSDCRIWERGRGNGGPGGPYLERSLLIGKAVFVYWPHSWNRIPGTPIPLPLFPNVSDMRIVR